MFRIQTPLYNDQWLVINGGVRIKGVIHSYMGVDSPPPLALHLRTPRCYEHLAIAHTKIVNQSMYGISSCYYRHQTELI